ncbi:MAG: urease subunit beta [Alphaproteobacteria bacterium]|nr:urease subunit beta [Alphaproteobacteria bacterium]
MIPGEILVAAGDIVLNEHRDSRILVVENHSTRPIDVGSHYHFFEVNAALRFDRDAAKGFRLDIPAGTTTRFEPGQPHIVSLVKYAGAGIGPDFNARV